MNTVIKKVAYHLQIYQIVREQILNGELKCGEKISEFGLAQKLGVSRSPVREALRMLEQDELLVGHGGGLIVNPMEFSDVKEIYDCRIVLEPSAAKMGCKLVTDEILEQLKEYIELSFKYHKEGKMKEVIHNNTKFHDLILSLCPNQHLNHIIEKTRSLSILARKEEFASFNRPEGYLIEHKQIIEALSSRDEDRVEAIMRQHITKDKEFYVARYSGGADSTYD